MKKYKHIGFALLFMLLYFVVTFVVAFTGLDSVVCTIIADVVITAVGIFYMRRVKTERFWKLSWSYIWYIIALLFGVWLFGQITATWYLSVYGDAAFDSYQDAVSVNPIAYLILTLVVAPVSEEIMMRGVVYNSVKRCWNMIIAGVVSSLIFAILHGTVVHILIAFMTGMLFAVVYEYTGDIKCNILLHMLYNSMSVLFGSMVLPEFLFSPIVFVTADVVLMAVIFMDYVRIQKRPGEVFVTSNDDDEMSIGDSNG